MKKTFFFMLCLCPFLTYSQAIINNWTLNSNGKKASYWKTTQSGMSVTYSFVNTTDSADVLAVCYTTDYVWVKSGGMTDYMGKYLNPGSCSTQTYIHKFPRNPSVPTTKTISPKGGAIGLLTNGIPIFGLGNAASWNGTTNANNGSGVWNSEVGKNEGFVLDTAFGAHPQQQGAYHTHTTPYRLYKYYASTVHSPLIGYAFDGNPIYGPYGYSSAMDATSATTRMKSGYSLRNITTRTTLPYGVTASQTGPAVSTTYPLGSYCEDYEWLASNGGHLDKYNGRTCVTPEYPSGTYAYFVTVDAAGVAAFPYYIGIEYYGAPESSNFSSGTSNTVTSPTGATCIYPTVLPLKLIDFKGFIQKNKNKLTWQTASEIEFSHFIIERSATGNDFKPLGKIKGNAPANTLQNYEFTDDDPQSLSYYRLTMVDKDGTQSLSKTLTLAQKQRQSIKVFPTIAQDIVYISSQNPLSYATITVTDLMGHVQRNAVPLIYDEGNSVPLIYVQRNAVPLIYDERNSVPLYVKMDISQLPKGMYLISVETKEDKTVSKIIKE